MVNTDRSIRNRDGNVDVFKWQEGVCSVCVQSFPVVAATQGEGIWHRKLDRECPEGTLRWARVNTPSLG